MQDFSEKTWKNFRLSLEKYEDEVINEYIKHAQKSLDKWNKQVKHAVGKQLPKKYWHKKRPNSRKLFPYRNTGKQQDNVLSGITKKITGQGNVSITAWAKIDVPYAKFTNIGLPKRKKGGKVGWVGWVGWETDLFEGKRGNILSIKDIFEELVAQRHII